MTKLKIMIDPGHGGRDPGAVGHGLQEKSLALTISRHLRDILQKNYDVSVSMTRDSDVFLSLEERARMANEWKADYFLSIHINAAGGTGFESYIHPNAPQKTSQFQQIIHQEILSVLKKRDRGKKKANFVVLRLTSMPALLTENLFIDNKDDARKLGDANILRTIAEGHANGLQRLLKLPVLKATPPSTSLYRVRVNGKQVGAFSDAENLLRQIRRHIGTANRIELEQVK